MTPVVKDLAQKYQGKVAVVEIDIDFRPDVATHYMVQSIPTLILFDRGREIKRFVGVQNKQALEKGLNDILSNRH